MMTPSELGSRCRLMSRIRPDPAARAAGWRDRGDEPRVVATRAKVAEPHEADQRGQPQYGQLLPGELACRQPPAGLHRAARATLGDVFQARRRKFGGAVSHEISRAIR